MSFWGSPGAQEALRAWHDDRAVLFMAMAEDEDAESPFGRCDECGAPCDEAGCIVDSDHQVAIE